MTEETKESSEGKALLGGAGPRHIEEGARPIVPAGRPQTGPKAPSGGSDAAAARAADK